MLNSSKKILVTGGAGFIGSYLVDKLVANGNHVTVIDNFDAFYPKERKLSNMAGFIQHPLVHFVETDIVDETALQLLDGHFDAIVHLAAKAGVRPSIVNPLVYQEVNVKGTLNLLEFARRNEIKQFIFGSSSSVYGINNNFPWKEDDPELNPISPYAGTKITGELLGHVYSHLYGIRFLALRFFTVFGPRQRPDLAIHLFSKKILRGEPINFFGNGTTKRDYTYVGDIVDGIFNAISYDQSAYEVFNLGNHHTVSLSEMIATIEEVFEKKATINYLPDQMGDLPVTYADISKAQQLLHYMPKTGFKEGVVNFKNWLLLEENV